MRVCQSAGEVGLVRERQLASVYASVYVSVFVSVYASMYVREFVSVYVSVYAIGDRRAGRAESTKTWNFRHRCWLLTNKIVVVSPGG